MEAVQTALQAAVKMPDWWQRIESDPEWQHYSNVVLAIAYGTIAAIALIQLVRIQMRVPDYGWTTQKVFHLLNFAVALLRCLVFAFRPMLSGLHRVALKAAIMDLPGLLFFTTYTLLVLFWAEIYHQARSLPTGTLRPIFATCNILVYFIQMGLLTFYGLAPNDSFKDVADLLSVTFLAFVSLMATVGFLLYGGRLFLMLRRFPIESRGRKKKLREVGLVTTICSLCFTIRAVMVLMSGTIKDDELDRQTHPLLNLMYYSLVEIIPASLVLYILRKLPPKRSPQAYQPLPNQVHGPTPEGP